MKNIEVINRFINHRGGINSHSTLIASFKYLHSYFTCIAEWTDGENLLVNMTKYLNTISRHVSLLIKALRHKVNIIELYNVPRGTISLVEWKKSTTPNTILG